VVLTRRICRCECLQARAALHRHQFVVGDLLQGRGLPAGKPEVEAGAFAFAERPRIESGEIAENHQGFEIVAIGAAVIEIVGPEAHFTEFDPVVGIGIGHAAGHRAEPSLADGNHAADERAAGGGLVVGGPNIPRHLLNRLAVPVSGRRVNGVGAGPGGDQADVHLWILAVQPFLLLHSDTKMYLSG